MRGGPTRLLLLLPVALALACTDVSRKAPTAVPQDAALAVALPAGCDFNTIRRDARSYLSSNDAILDMLRALQDALRNGDPGAYNLGLNVLARVAEARNAGITGAPAAGASVVLGTLTCIGAAPLPTLAELTSTLGTDADGGVFQVLGGATDPTGAAVAAAATPLWGAEPQQGESWSSSAGERFVLYAYRLEFATFTNESPALLTPGSPTEEGTAFQMRTIPQNVFEILPLVGVCVENPARYRVQNILMRQDLAFCAAGGSTASATQPRGLLAVASQALSWFAPKPLYAAALIGGGTGGLPSGFSPFGAVDVEASSIQLTIDHIADGNRTTPMTVTVRARSANGNPVDNVLIKLLVAGNNGLGSDGEYELIDVEGVTANGGVVTFTVLLDKAGAYKVRADGYFNQDDDLPTLSATSNRFNIGS